MAGQGSCVAVNGSRSGENSAIIGGTTQAVSVIRSLLHKKSDFTRAATISTDVATVNREFSDGTARHSELPKANHSVPLAECW
jgi:hypothetical protein